MSIKNIENLKDENKEVKKETSKKDEYTKEGTVVNCNKLNVRSAANINSKIKVVLEKDDNVLISLADSTDSFYSIKTKDNKIVGFCMKQYIRI